jgi:uncharacterized membrane protein YphA (DoxX/SURF4 family)
MSLESMFETAIRGPQIVDFALLVERVAVGSFFAISGYHKLFHKERHAAMVKTMEELNIPAVKFNQWWVPFWEFAAGTTLAVGFLTIPSAIILGCICLVATCTAGFRQAMAYGPVDAADHLDDILYLPEVLYGIMLITTLCAGPGKFSLDFHIWG